MSAAAAIGSTAGLNPSTPAPAGLDAQKAQYQKQLADCVNCASSKTPQGQAKIQQLTAKLGAIEARLQAAADARTATSKAADVADPAAASTPKDTLSPLGQTLDAYA
jgi:hypothetical protein